MEGKLLVLDQFSSNAIDVRRRLLTALKSKGIEVSNDCFEIDTEFPWVCYNSSTNKVDLVSGSVSTKGILLTADEFAKKLGIVYY
jgi:hypothetical protein